MKKLLSIVLVFCMSVAMIPSALATEETFIINGVTVSVSSGTSLKNCSAYASQVLKKIWNYKGVTTTFNSQYNMLKGYSASEREITEAHTREFIQNAPLGSRIRITSYNDTTTDNYDNNRNGHTLVLVAKDNINGTFTTLESGWGCAEARTYTYRSFVDKTKYKYFFYIADLTSFGTNIPITPTVHTITFDPNGGTVNPKTKTVTAGNEIGTLPTPARDGYTFLYWSTEKYSSGMVVSKGNLIVEKNQTLYAQWKKEGTPPSHEHTYVDDKCSICGTSLSSDNGFDNSAAGKYVVIANRAYVRTGPYQSKSEKYRLNRWDEISVVGSVVNSYGNTWLKTSDGYYTHADKLERVIEQPPKTEITFNDLTSPGNLTVGKGGHIDGSITSSNSPICSVRAEVCDSSGNVYLTATSSGFSRSTYGPIKDSRIDNKLTFGKLPAGDYYIKYTVTTEDNTTAFAKTSVFSVFSANNDDAVKGSSTPSDSGGNTFSSTINYWNCNTIISCFNGQTVNLYSNPGDSSRVTYFSKGQTAKSTRGATLSDGSIWYSVTVNHNGTNKLLWLKYDGSKMTYTDISN